jgi:hypothetical protein
LTAVLVEPLQSGLVDDVPGVLVEQQPPAGSEQPRDLLDRGGEVVDVVQRAVRDHRGERAGVGEVLERHAPEQVALGCMRVDRQDVVLEPSHREGERPVAAADLEHAGGRSREVGGNERFDVHPEVVPSFV